MSTAPTGTVTLLFSDIEGSTRLIQQLGERYPAVLAAHQQLLRPAFQAHGGYEVHTEGDSFFVAFARAGDALKAAIAAQQALAAHPWPGGGMVRVRMGLHTGEPIWLGNDYTGLDVHRAARLCSAGHGGQILLSQSTAVLVELDLPEGITLRDLGAHRLKDLLRPEQIFQLVAADLSATFPPLKTLNAHPTNLPIQATALIGRERDIATIHDLLRRDAVRLLTLTGPGGTGKTRLALHVAAEMLDSFADGVYFVALAPISDPDLVASAIAQSLSVKEVGNTSVLESLKEHLHAKQVLLLLDNFEQILPAAEVVSELLRAAEGLKVLITSRTVLHLYGEREFAVPPLTLPDFKQLPPIDRLTQYDAVRLFIERAQAVKPEFVITNDTAPAVAEICARLDGLPLAIELAAARSKLFTPQTLLARLDQRLKILVGGARNLPARQQTLRNTLDWSYNLLNADEQSLFRRLGIFAGGCTLEAAECVCNATGDLPLDIVDGLQSLLDKSLLQSMSAHDDELRFVMLETIREYAMERIEVSGEAEHLSKQHAKYYLMNSPKRAGENDEIWGQRTNRDYDNLRAALAWNQTMAGDSEAALQLVGILCHLWHDRGIRHEGIATLQHTLAHPLGVGRTLAHANARIELGLFLGFTGNYAAAEIQYEQALPIARELDDTFTYPWILSRLGGIARERGDSTTAWRQLAEGVAIYRQQGDSIGLAWALNTLAGVAILDEDPARAEELLAESRTLWQNDGSNWYSLWHGWTLNHLGHAAQLRGEFVRANALHHESVEVFYALGEQNFGLPWAYHSLGETALGLGHLADAARWFAQGLTLSQTLCDQASIAWCLAGIGSVLSLNGAPERGVRLWGAAEQLRQTIGCRPAPAARVTYERAVTTVRTLLSNEAFAMAWEAGQALISTQASAEARLLLSELERSQSITQMTLAPTPTTSYPAGLTEREVEILRLVAQGLTDAQVAERLVISPRTVQGHLRSIYSKLDVTSRTAASRVAINSGLC